MDKTDSYLGCKDKHQLLQALMVTATSAVERALPEGLDAQLAPEEATRLLGVLYEQLRGVIARLPDLPATSA
jgi:hypothetical protein